MTMAMKTNRFGGIGNPTVMLIPIAGESAYLAVTDTAAPFDFGEGAGMEERGIYSYACTVDSWIAQGETPVASAAAGSMFVPARTVVLIDAAQGENLSALREGGSSGKASLTKMSPLS